MQSRIDFSKFKADLIETLGFDGSEVHEEMLMDFLHGHFGNEKGDLIRSRISDDLSFFLHSDPASADYSETQILSVRRGMTAIASHRIFQEVLKRSPENLYDIEVVAKSIQKDTNVEIHPSADIDVPFAIDHGHSTVIGATAKVGKRAFMYHSVTLGASGMRSRAQRRHPVVGDNAFFGNGSQVLGPAILGDNVNIASSVAVKDSLIEDNVRIAMRVRVSGVVIPKGTHVFSEDPENRQKYWVHLATEDKPKWIVFDRFNPGEFE